MGVTSKYDAIKIHATIMHRINYYYTSLMTCRRVLATVFATFMCLFRGKMSRTKLSLARSRVSRFFSAVTNILIFPEVCSRTISISSQWERQPISHRHSEPQHRVLLSLESWINISSTRFTSKILLTRLVTMLSSLIHSPCTIFVLELSSFAIKNIIISFQYNMASVPVSKKRKVY